MPDRSKVDLHASYAADYAAPRRPCLLTPKPGRYLAVSGRGDPDGAAFQAKVRALYGVAYAVKMAWKRAGRDYGVPRLEGLWWGVGRDRWMIRQARKNWRWRLLLRVPDFVRAADVTAAARQLRARGRGASAGAVRLTRLAEGRCVQVLHVGRYVDEQPTLEAMLAVAQAHGLKYVGRHHEIYLSDPARVKPERLRTILRHPVR